MRQPRGAEGKTRFFGRQRRSRLAWISRRKVGVTGNVGLLRCSESDEDASEDLHLEHRVATEGSRRLARFSNGVMTPGTFAEAAAPKLQKIRDSRAGVFMDMEGCALRTVELGARIPAFNTPPIPYPAPKCNLRKVADVADALVRSGVLREGQSPAERGRRLWRPAFLPGLSPRPGQRRRRDALFLPVRCHSDDGATAELAKASGRREGVADGEDERLGLRSSSESPAPACSPSTVP